jgi:hypothetical protein
MSDEVAKATQFRKSAQHLVTTILAKRSQERGSTPAGGHSTSRDAGLSKKGASRKDK